MVSEQFRDHRRRAATAEALIPDSLLLFPEMGAEEKDYEEEILFFPLPELNRKLAIGGIWGM